MSFACLRLMAAVICAFGAACGPRYQPQSPGSEPGSDTVGSVTRGPTPTAPSEALREILVGEMCPQAAAGRPAIKPLLIRRVTWSARAEDVTRPVETRTARQFSVFGWDGRRVGVFSVAGASEDPQGTVAVGSYAGASPCQVAPARGGGAEEGAASVDDACVAAMSHCGVAVAVLEPSGGPTARPFAEDADPTAFELGGACSNQKSLFVDIDGDRTTEVFRLADFLDAMRAPADEVSASTRKAQKAPCSPSFAVPGAMPGADPRDWRGLDVLAVIDLDGDGRRELVLRYRYADRSTWAVYRARSTPGRLELVGEGVPWPR